jgi:hypothetical protein
MEVPWIRTYPNQRNIRTPMAYPAQQWLLPIKVEKAPGYNGGQPWRALDNHTRVAGAINLDGCGPNALQRNRERLGDAAIVVDDKDQLGRSRHSPL